MKYKWSKKNVTLKYMVGDYVIFRYNLKMKVMPFQTISEYDTNAYYVKPSDALLEDERGYLMRSVPLQKKQATLNTDGQLIYYIPDQFNRYYINLNQSFEEYIQKFSSKTRSTMRRKIKKFSSHCNGKMKWKSYRNVSEMKEFYKLARIVSEKSYQEKLLESGLPDEKSFEKKMINLAQVDQVRGYLLFDDKKPIAYIYCPVIDNVLLYQFLGYDPSYFKWSVGTILHWYAFEDIFNEAKFRYFDFTEGQSDHKKMFSTGGILCGNVYIFPKKISTIILVYTHKNFNLFSEKIGNLLDQIGLKAKIKRFLRFGLTS